MLCAPGNLIQRFHHCGRARCVEIYAHSVLSMLKWSDWGIKYLKSCANVSRDPLSSSPAQIIHYLAHQRTAAWSSSQMLSVEVWRWPSTHTSNAQQFASVPSLRNQIFSLLIRMQGNKINNIQQEVGERETTRSYRVFESTKWHIRILSWSLASLPVKLWCIWW